jgi:hypothetical protein
MGAPSAWSLELAEIASAHALWPSPFGWKVHWCGRMPETSSERSADPLEEQGQVSAYQTSERSRLPRRVVILGAAGRDFHTFNVVYRSERRVGVVAFAASQIPFIDDRTCPASLAGEGYPRGIPIHDESELTQLIKER